MELNSPFLIRERVGVGNNLYILSNQYPSISSLIMEDFFTVSST